MPSGGTSPENREEALAYIFDMSRALREVAEQHNLPFLAYLLEMVALASVGRGKEE